MNYQIIPVTPFEQNCTLFWCPSTKEAAVIDPGGDLDRITAALEANALLPVKILLTHGHLDHCAGSARLAELLGVPIIGPHPDDAFLLDSMPAQSQMFGFPRTESFKPDQWLNHGDRVQLGDETLEVIHCPGHTPGHVVLFNRVRQIAQVGDVLFKGSIGRTDFPRGNHRQLLSSIRDRLFPLGPDVRFIPGHGPMSTLGHEERTNPFVGTGG